MTCLEKFRKEYPDLVLAGKCPQDFGYFPQRPWDCFEISCYKECWLREPIESANGGKEAHSEV